MTPEQRQRILIIAAEKYMKGEIELPEYNRLCREHQVDYRAAALAIAKARDSGSKS